MKIMDIAKSWYKELFWMGVGATAALGIEAAVKYIRAKQLEKKKKETFEKIKHDVEETIPEYQECTTQADTDKDVEMAEVVRERLFEIWQRAVDRHEEEDAPVAEPEAEPNTWTEISADEFAETNHGPSIYDRYEIVYDPENGMYGYSDGIDEDLGLDSISIWDMLGEFGVWYELHGSRDVQYFKLKSGIYVAVHQGVVDE